MSSSLMRDNSSQPPLANAHAEPGGASFKSTLRHAAPSLAILATLAVLAVWGHSTEWTLPSLSSLTGRSEEPAAWCLSHNVPHAECIECNATLLAADKDYGWCKEHGVAQCPLHHLDVVQLASGEPPTPADLEQARRALALVPRGENNSLCKLYQRRIQFASLDALEKAGIDIAVAVRRPVLELITANGQLIYDQTHTATLASRVAGTTWRVEKQVGDRVRKGDVLALIDAVEIGRTKADLLQAIAQLRLRQTTVDHMRPLVKEGGIAGKQFLEAETALQETQIRLLTAQQTLVNLGMPLRAEDYADLPADKIAAKIHFLGLPAEIASGLDPETTTSNLFPLRSPLDGVVVERKVVAGEVVDTTDNLFAVADVSRLWLMLDVRQEDANYLSLGQSVRFSASDRHDEPRMGGTIGWISTSADPQTRTVRVRVELPNPDARLRANTFGIGRIVLREEPRAVTVPSEALHWDGCCHVVFVRDKHFLEADSPKFFHIRQVRVGVKEGQRAEIIAGLLPGEIVANKNSVILEAQLLKSNLGAGCGCANDH